MDASKGYVSPINGRLNGDAARFGICAATIRIRAVGENANVKVETSFTIGGDIASFGP